MRKIIILILLLPLLYAGTIYAQKNSIGAVKYKITYEGETIKLNLFLSGDKFKAEETTSKGSRSLIFAGGIAVILYPAQTIYAEYNDLNDAFREMVPPIFPNTSDELMLTKTGEMKKILGIECEKWTLKNPVTSIVMWVAKDLEFNASVIDALPAYFVDWKKIVKREQVLPLIIHIKDDLGNTLYTFEAYDLSAGVPSAKVFTVPEKYKNTGKKYTK